jgi:NADH-quinone oxidoreductase subunit N
MLAGLAAYRTQTGFSTGNDENLAISSVLYYLLAYTFMNIGAFAIVVWVQHRGRGMELEDFAGLGSSNPLAAAAMTVFMISLMGIPPTIGFYGKYYVIVALIESDLLWLALSIVVMSAVSAYFYLRVVATMYFSGGKDNLRSVSTPMLNVGIALMVIGVFALGLFSESIINLADEWSSALTLTAQVVP